MKSTEMQMFDKYVLVKPVLLETGEARTESGIVIDLDQNNSIINRPTEGEIVSSNSGGYDVGMFIKWVETDGEDVDLEDGKFIVLRTQSVLGYKNV